MNLRIRPHFDEDFVGYDGNAVTITHRAVIGALSLALVGGGLACSSSSKTADAGLNWFTTCGAPVCQDEPDGAAATDGGAAADGGVAACVTEKAGDSCATAGATCDPGLGCDVLLRCADKDPKVQAGGCPISRRAAKRDIAYLDAEAKARLVEELRRLRLAQYRYRDAPDKQRLGFIIDDVPNGSAVDGPRDQIDLYSYLSMAVAALQQEMARGDAQERELAALRRRLDAMTTAPKRAVRGQGRQLP
jgi:hypothetical protein